MFHLCKTLDTLNYELEPKNYKIFSINPDFFASEASYIFKLPRILCLKNVNFVKNETLQMWILSKNDIFKMWILLEMIFSKCEFCQKWDFENANLGIKYGFEM